MFARWSPENFFQHMMQHLAIDRLVDYQPDQIDETAPVVNPAFRKLEREFKTKAAKRTRKLAQFDELAMPKNAEAQQIEAFEQAMGQFREDIELLKIDLAALKGVRNKTPKHVPLAPTRKPFFDTIKMIAYRAETAMAGLLRDVMARPDDTRARLREFFATEANPIPDERAGTLTVALHHLTNLASDEAARFPAQQLNATETVYPGINPRLVFKLVSD